MASIYGFKVFYEEKEKKQRKAYLETIDFSAFDEDSFVDSLMNISDSRERLKKYMYAICQKYSKI